MAADVTKKLWDVNQIVALLNPKKSKLVTVLLYNLNLDLSSAIMPLDHWAARLGSQHRGQVMGTC